MEYLIIVAVLLLSVAFGYFIVKKSKEQKDVIVDEPIIKAQVLPVRAVDEVEIKKIFKSLKGFDLSRVVEVPSEFVNVGLTYNKGYDKGIYAYIDSINTNFPNENLVFYCIDNENHYLIKGFTRGRVTAQLNKGVDISENSSYYKCRGFHIKYKYRFVIAIKPMVKSKSVKQKLFTPIKDSILEKYLISDNERLGFFIEEIMYTSYRKIVYIFGKQYNNGDDWIQEENLDELVSFCINNDKKYIEKNDFDEEESNSYDIGVYGIEDINNVFSDDVKKYNITNSNVFNSKEIIKRMDEHI